MWFEKLTGFREESPEDVRANLQIEGNELVSKANGRRLKFGKLEMATLHQLRKESSRINFPEGEIKVSEVVGDVQQLHTLPENDRALFQAASQFNLLEMTSPNVIPEMGIDRYDKDHTQGPACAIACGAGTIFRNYFVGIDEQFGQTKDKQIDCLDKIGKELKNEQNYFWRMRNGYALMDENGLRRLNGTLLSFTEEQREELKGKLKVGIQWDTEVTITEVGQQVSQIYCSALPVAYCQAAPHLWEVFSRVILEATYEATFLTALINMHQNGSNKVYLTLVGGGAFGNKQSWILDSLEQAIQKFGNVPLDVRIVSYGKANPLLKSLVKYQN